MRPVARTPLPCRPETIGQKGFSATWRDVDQQPFDIAIGYCLEVIANALEQISFSQMDGRLNVPTNGVRRMLGDCPDSVLLQQDQEPGGLNPQMQRGRKSYPMTPLNLASRSGIATPT